ncbi:MAG TPA: AMP-binding protein [Burkholderiaceae bacterium]|nr:AMP-binding protein [Burkholderiaceae bacterium]
MVSGLERKRRFACKQPLDSQQPPEQMAWYTGSRKQTVSSIQLGLRITMRQQQVIMQTKPWLSSYPSQVPAEISVQGYESLADLLGQACQRYANRTALIFMGSHLSYAQLDRTATCVAAWLAAQGLEEGSRIGIMMPNTMPYLPILLGILRAGMVVVNINPVSTAYELDYLLRDSRTSLVFVFDRFLTTFSQLATVKRPAKTTQTDSQLKPEQATHLNSNYDPQQCRLVSVLPGDLLGLKAVAINLAYRHQERKQKKVAPKGVLRFPTVLSQGRRLRRQWQAPRLQLSDLAILQYTGGTTGVPRGALLSHGNLVANVLQITAVAQPVMAKPDEKPMVMLGALPLCHIFALTVCGLFALSAGMQTVLIADPRRLDTVIAAWRKTPISILPAVNTLFNALLRRAEFREMDFSGLRLCFGGGAAVQEAVARRWHEVTGRAIIEGYGLTETSPVAAVNPTNAQSYSGDIGLPLPSTDIRIVDDEGQFLPYGSEGEIAIKGPQVMTGYWQQPQASAKAFTSSGHFLTGDMGIMCEQGRIKIIDRKKDMVLVAGFNVYPNEVEQVAATHPDVAECLAVGVPNPSTGEKLMLFVVPANNRLTQAAVRDWLIERLSPYKRPHAIHFRDELPKSHAGKLLRRVLRAEQMALQEQATPTQPQNDQTDSSAEDEAAASSDLSAAKLQFDERGVPYSHRYGDVYHPPSGAIEQANYVFIAGNGLPQRWQGRASFAVYETGFGLGQNFLALWQAWRNDPKRSQELHFVSFEAHPFAAADLERVLRNLPSSYQPQVQRLIQAWPPATPGVHQLVFSESNLPILSAPPSSSKNQASESQTSESEIPENRTLEGQVLEGRMSDSQVPDSQAPRKQTLENQVAGLALQSPWQDAAPAQAQSDPQEVAMSSRAHKLQPHYRVVLSLVFGDIRKTLPQVVQPRKASSPYEPGLHSLFESKQTDVSASALSQPSEAAVSAWPRLPLADAIFLDGFAPRGNPEMWSPEIFQYLQALAAEDATAATWSSAAAVRQALGDVGFTVERQKGFAGKRHMIVARRKPTK